MTDKKVSSQEQRQAGLAPSAAVLVATVRALKMHGGIAMTKEYELAHIAKRIVMCDHRFGDADYHLERFIELSAA